MFEYAVDYRGELRAANNNRWIAAVAVFLAWGLLILPLSTAAADDENLSGRMLVATTQIGDPRFAKTVIYMLQHDQAGAMGLVVNRPVGRLSYKQLLEEMGEDGAHAISSTFDVFYGGPVESQRGFVLHSLDYRDDDTRVISNFSGVTTSRKIVRAIAEGRGPQRFLFILGYAGWAPGQLEGEIRRRSWVSVDADELLVLGDDHAEKWDVATARRGVDL